MNRGIDDWLRACLAAAVLVGAAALLVFLAHPGGSPAQVGWYAGLLPGSVVAALLGGFVQDLFPHAQRIAYFSRMLVISFLWYFVIAYIVLKIVRAASQAKKA